MATDKMTTENLKVFEEKEKRGLPIWAWLLPLFILLMIGIWLYSRHSNTRTAAEATPVTDQTKPDNGAAATQAGSALTAAGIADSIRTNGRVSLNNSDVHFATGSATLAGNSQSVLDQTARALKSNADCRMRIIGHTDSVGSASANEQLAQQRASSVMSYLTAHGVDQSRLTIDAKGGTQPVSTNNSDAGRAENRRVELIKM
jgi:outer membrane protein OmpA-like peptidoglycan-associated protein